MRRPALAVVAILAVVFTLTIGTLVRTGRHHRMTAAVPAGVPALPPPAAASPPPVATGSDVGGARAAAIVAVASTPAVLRAGPLSRRDLIAGFATERFTGELTARSNDQARSLLVGPGVDTVSVVEVPITATATIMSDGSVSVRVWSVFAVAVSLADPAREVWRTTTVTMRLEAGRWRVDGWLSSVGPTPAQPVDPGGFAWYREFAQVASWPSVLAVG